MWAGCRLFLRSVKHTVGSPFYSRIEIGTHQNSSLDVELRLDSPSGQLIGTLNVPSRDEPWFMTREDITTVTGTHDLYVVFQGDGGSTGKFDRIRLLNTNVGERVTLGVKNHDNQGSITTEGVGGAYWASRPESVMFTTGPNAESATIFITKQGGHDSAARLPFLGSVSRYGVGVKILRAQIGSETVARQSLRPIPIGRIRRLTALGTLQAKIGAAYLFHWLRGWFESAEKNKRRVAEVHWRTALRLLDSMSYLRGAVMKVGQTLANFPDIAPREFSGCSTSL